MTARECLRHRWLTSNRKSNGTNKASPLRSDVSSQPDPTRRVGCSSCPPSTNQKNLRKYLSKSREALFEKVISRSKEQPQENLRKTTLLSRYHKTRRMCESQMSLVSKSRERLMSDQKSMAPSLHKSREKLYGLRSLSKSHEVLNLCKTVGGLNSDLKVPESSPLRGILKTLTRTTTTDISAVATEVKKDNNPSIINLGVQEKTDPEVDYPECKVKESTNNELESAVLVNEFKNDNNLTNVVVSLEVQPLQSVLTFICKNSINNEPKIEQENTEDSNKENVAVDDRVQEHSMDLRNKTNEEDNASEKKERHRPPPIFTKQFSLIQSDEDPQSPDANLDSLSLTEGTSTSCSEISDEDAGSLERITGDFSTEEDEPRYTVAQLISAYNLHQEIVTKCSLEVTMSSDNLETKIPPLIEKVPNKKFPTGPNALRLFIPNIDIASRCVKRSAKKKPTMRSAHKKIDEIKEESKENTTDEALSLGFENCSNDNNEVPRRLCEPTEPIKSNKPYSESEKPVVLRDTKFKLDKSDSKERCRLSTESPTKNFVRSSSISSEASFKSSGASSNITTSMEELSPTERRSRSNRSSGIASSDGDHPSEIWIKPITTSAGSSRTSEKLSTSTPRPNRKSFCSPRAPAIHTDSKTRRKSSPIMKPFY